MDLLCSSLSRLTRLEQGGIRLFEGVLRLREGVVLQASRAAGDAAVVFCQAICSPLIVSSPRSQHVEALASSYSPPSCSELASEIQGPEPNQDISSARALETASLLPGLAPSHPSHSSSQDDGFVQSLEHTQQQHEGSYVQGPEQTHDDSDSVPVAHKDELAYPEMLGKDVLLCEEGLCGLNRGALSLEGEERESVERGIAQGCEQTQAVSESVPAALKDELVYPELLDERKAVVCEKDREVAQGSNSHETLPEGSCEIDRLDGGALLQIMSRLDSPSLINSSLVCRTWAEESCIARSSLTVQKGAQSVNLSTALYRFPRLQTLKILRAQSNAELSFCDTHLTRIGLRAPQLQHLEIEGCNKFSDVGLADMLRNCRQLRCLSLKRCGGFEGKAFEGVCCQLTTVKLVECQGVSNAGLIALGSACPGLQVFTLLTATNSAALAPGLEGLARQCGALSGLKLHGCGITDASLSRLAASCPGLVLAGLSCEPAITDAGVAAFDHALPQLQCLGLTDNQGLRRVPRSGSGLPLRSLSLGWLLKHFRLGLPATRRGKGLGSFADTGLP